MIKKCSRYKRIKFSPNPKRIFDIIASLMAFPFLLPFFAITAIAIKLDSSGPIFYRGWRTGLGGRPFRIFKFRTMVQNAEKIGSGTTALGDSRITRIGGFLRKYKIDELPQFINVIIADMSIVGPRPELLEWTQKYSENEKCILDVKPGISDLSSVEFSSLDECVGPTDAHMVFKDKFLSRKNELRIKYVNERSFWLDIKIILMTIQVILLKMLRNKRTIK